MALSLKIHEMNFYVPRIYISRSNEMEILDPEIKILLYYVLFYFIRVLSNLHFTSVKLYCLFRISYINTFYRNVFSIIILKINEWLNIIHIKKSATKSRFVKEQEKVARFNLNY